MLERFYHLGTQLIPVVVFNPKYFHSDFEIWDGRCEAAIVVQVPFAGRIEEITVSLECTGSSLCVNRGVYSV